MASLKTKVVEHLFDQNWDASSGTLTKSLMSLDDVGDAIRTTNVGRKNKLKDNNPANFMKDLLRGSKSNENWPASVTARKYTGIQRTGDGECFEFVPFEPGQTEPFPDKFPVRGNAPKFLIQSLSLPLATKTLGRSDETWLIQTAVNLRVIETHFAVAGAFKLLEVVHLQMGIKLRSTEIDALFLGKIGNLKNPESILITCEAKQAKDRFIESQIVNQVKSTFATTEVETVVPIGLKAIKKVGFYLAEFEAIKRADAGTLKNLTLAGDAIYQLCPAVKGI
ncbi:hypothetical protein BMG03_13750 [Thioclava nitratireducens]|uniref:Restriction endonuclease n=1 Tax=Thioclava nitratireducens TaxID=1915078 RepID=A0ABN4XGK2_9RHOB|nr:hypothetical protein [Thioclava nitratireducens]AQS48738.1 hypothetical protein BMG03_13750 [Thioclava nitratireducens]